MEEMQLQVIAHIYNDYPSKFGIPRQSGLVDTMGKIVFEREFAQPDCVKGLEEYSHLWLLWQFSENMREGWKATVRPPRLGGNSRKGVFATRSPFRPNPIGLSCVKLDRIEMVENQGPVLYVTGADLMNGTPIFDIKPYIPYADSYPEAKGSFAQENKDYHLQVEFAEGLLEKIPVEKRTVLHSVLSQDPRPSYQDDESRIYGMEFANMEVKFSVKNDVLFVENIIQI